jgi:formamidopyrimidine-DNA glycosylase
MPELPEVEVVRAGLARWVVGRTIADVAVLHPRSVRRHIPGAVDFTDRIVGRTVTEARRRGKYLWLPLADEPASKHPNATAPDTAEPDTALIGHLGMSGQLLMVDALAASERHLRIQFTFTDGGPQLRFVDQRTFGGLHVDDLVDIGHGDRIPAQIAHIARDPLDPLFDDAAWADAVRRRHTGIKRALLDQSLISGIGNIYADESLWRARLHWARPTETLTRPVLAGLLGHVRAVLTEALREGGTSFDSLYVNVNGESGYFDRSLNAYGREGEPCPRCGMAIRRDAFMNRSSFSCPRCQPRPRNARL